MSLNVDPAMLAMLPPAYLAEDRSAPLLHSSIAFAVLQTVFIVLFFVSRYLNKTANGVEFWVFMPLAYLFCMVHCVSGILMVEIGGAGRHAAALLLEDPKKIINWLKIDKVEEYMYMGSITFPKLAILCLYMRIFGTSKMYIYATYTTGGVIICNLLVGWLSSSIICRPFAYHWDKTIKGGTCGDIMGVYKWVSIPNLITDVFMLLLPMPAIYKLQIGSKAKIGLLLTFLTGSFGIIGSIIRLVQFFTVDLFADPTFNCINTMMWTIIEPGIYLIAATMPTLRPLKRKILKNVSFINIISSGLGYSSGSKGSSGFSKGSTISKNNVVRTTEFRMESGDDDASTKSINPSPGDGFIPLDDYHRNVTVTGSRDAHDRV